MFLAWLYVFHIAHGEDGVGERVAKKAGSSSFDKPAFLYYGNL